LFTFGFFVKFTTSNRNFASTIKREVLKKLIIHETEQEFHQKLLQNSSNSKKNIEKSVASLFSFYGGGLVGARTKFFVDPTDLIFRCRLNGTGCNFQIIFKYMQNSMQALNTQEILLEMLSHSTDPKKESADNNRKKL
jgi:hypothetical protein